MTTLFLRLIAIALSCTALPAAAADVGRVLLAAGDATAVRGNQTVRLTFGTTIQDKDVLRTGAASNLQVRFVDESIVSMKESSELRIDEFQFSGTEDGSERAFFRLLKGGLRTVTGLIGRANHKNYQMSTTTASIGIRGTDYSATLCQGDCRNSDGTLAKDGLYGRTHGPSHGTNRIDVANSVDQKSFGINENFYVADNQSKVEPLLVAPDFVSNRLEGRRQGGTKDASSGSGKEQASSSSGVQAESRLATPPPSASTDPLAFTSTQDLGPGGVPSVLSPTAAIAFSFQGDADGALIQQAQLTRAGSGATEALTGFTVTFFNESGSDIAKGTTTASAVADIGFGADVNAHWGRWTSGTITDVDGTRTVGSPGVGQLHYIYADLTPVDVFASKSGVFSFNRIGGTTPTDGNGNVASAFSFSPATVDFTNRTINFSFMSWTIAGVTHSFSGASGLLRPNDSPPANTIMTFDVQATNPVGCSGGVCSSGSSASLNATGGFAGKTGNHFGGVFSTTSAAGNTNSAQLFFCPTCP
jgi:hypothetical protein